MYLFLLKKCRIYTIFSVFTGFTGSSVGAAHLQKVEPPAWNATCCWAKTPASAAHGQPALPSNKDLQPGPVLTSSVFCFSKRWRHTTQRDPNRREQAGVGSGSGASPWFRRRDRFYFNNFRQSRGTFTDSECSCVTEGRVNPFCCSLVTQCLNYVSVCLKSWSSWSFSRFRTQKLNQTPSTLWRVSTTLQHESEAPGGTDDPSGTFWDTLETPPWRLRAVAAQWDSGSSERIISWSKTKSSQVLLEFLFVNLQEMLFILKRYVTLQNKTNRR